MHAETLSRSSVLTAIKHHLKAIPEVITVRMSGPLKYQQEKASCAWKRCVHMLGILRTRPSQAHRSSDTGYEDSSQHVSKNHCRSVATRWLRYPYVRLMIMLV